ncbi:MAG: TolC family protein [Elusimicrobia bacterium]|nr:TolC family protein [Elusimicrobiota bacterium]
MRVLLLLLALPVAAKEPQPLSFDDLPRLVAEHNDEARGSALQAESAKKRLGHLGRSWLPSVEGIAGGERFQTGAYPWRSEPYGSLEAVVNVFRGGHDAIEERTRRGQAALAESAYRRSAAEELFEARKAYWELVSTRERLGIVQDAAGRNEKHLELAERRIKAGMATEADRLEFQINRSVLAEEEESLRHEAELIQIALAARVGSSPGTQFVTSTSVPHAHDDALLATAGTVPPSVSWLQASEAVAAGQGSAAARWWAPSLDLYGGYSLYTLRDRDYLSQSMRDDRAVGLRLRIPLFDGLRSRAEASALSLKREGYARQASQASATYSAELERSKEELRHLHELVHNGEERITQGRRYLTVIIDEYGRGVKNSVDVLSAAQRQLGFLRQSAERRRDYALAQTRVLQLLGR